MRAFWKKDVINRYFKFINGFLMITEISDYNIYIQSIKIAVRPFIGEKPALIMV